MNKLKVNTADATTYVFKCYWILGICVPQRHKRLYLLYSFCLNVGVTLFMPISFVISYIIRVGEQVQIGYLLTSMQVAIDVFGSGLKIGIMACMLHRLRSADVLLQQLDARCETDAEVAQQRKIVRFGRRIIVFLTITYLAYSLSTFLGSLAMGRAPYSIYLPGLNWKRSKWEFFFVSLIEFLMMNVAVLQQTANDSCSVIYVCILHAHLNILIMRIKNLVKSSNKTMQQNLCELKLCIMDHKKIIDLYNAIAPVISVTTFVQFMVTSTILGTTLINMLLFATDFSSRLASLIYLFAVTMEILPLCYYTQCLMEESDRLSHVIFHSNWINQNSSYRKLLVFFMQRTQQTIKFSACKLFPITLHSFLSIAKFSFSLYTLIKGMGIKERLGLN